MLKEIVFPQAFTMIGGDDHPRPIEYVATLQVVEQLTQLIVKISQTVVVGIASQGQVMSRQLQLVDGSPGVVQNPALNSGLRLLAEAVRRPCGKLVRRMGIEVVEKDEEGTPRFASSV